MRLPQATIKQAILHAEEEVRLTALSYFSRAYSDDPSIMPLVIKAVETHGRSQAFRILRDAEGLPQSPATIDWLINELRQDFNTQEIDSDNLRFALALVLTHADPELLFKRHSEIIALPVFPEELKQGLDEALKLHFLDWPTLWREFEELGRRTMAKDSINVEDNRRFDRLSRAMARHRDDGADTVLALLRRNYKGRDKALMEWLEPQIVELAGALRIARAIPLLMKRIDEGYDAVIEEVCRALIRIGTDAAVNAVAHKWWDADIGSRFLLAEVLEHIHTDLALERALAFLDDEEDMDVALFLGESVLAHFSTESIEPTRALVLEDAGELEGEQWDLRYKLVATVTIMGATFPEYEEWHDEAVATNYGWEKVKDKTEPYRVSESFVESEGRSGATRRGEYPPSTVYRLKITLKDIDPPIWRRIEVPECVLTTLHKVIQTAMGWDDTHHYAFEIDDRQYVDPDTTEGESEMEDASKTCLSDVLEAGARFIYRYDFGDNWLHEIVVEKVETDDDGRKYPECLEGRRACPPEDVGGSWGYAEYLNALGDPKHPSHAEMHEWGDEFAPEAFDMKEVNRRLRRMWVT